MKHTREMVLIKDFLLLLQTILLVSCPNGQEFPSSRDKTGYGGSNRLNEVKELASCQASNPPLTL